VLWGTVSGALFTDVEEGLGAGVHVLLPQPAKLEDSAQFAFSAPTEAHKVCNKE
jgi:hypothetical protein